MYEYKFVRCALKYSWRGGVDAELYRDTIHEHAAEGWRLVQVLVENPSVTPTEYQLIFERTARGEAAPATGQALLTPRPSARP